MPFKDWRQFIPFYFYSAVGVCLSAAIAIGKGPSLAVAFVLLISGFLSWGLIEYGIHRFIFHYEAQSTTLRRFVHAAHLAHHENPKSKSDLFASLRFSMPIAGVYWLLGWAILGTWQAASYLFIGLTAGYFCYEWLHLQAHHGKSRLSLFRYLKKYHLLHHYRTPDLRFGVTSPMFDLIFGSFKRIGDMRPSTKRLLAGPH